MKTVDELVAFSSGVEGQGIIDHQNCTYTVEELRALARRLIELPKGSVVVEIGTFAGRSASLYFQLQRELDLDIHLVDNWSWNQAHATKCFDTLVIEHFNEVPFTLHKMRSDYLGERWNIPITFLHIDGWHDMPGIEPDCRLWTPHVIKGGVVAFHDSDCPPVKECIDRYINSGSWVPMDLAYRTTTWKRINV